jgi:hypothetical protein
MRKSENIITEKKLRSVFKNQPSKSLADSDKSWMVHLNQFKLTLPTHSITIDLRFHIICLANLSDFVGHFIILSKILRKDFLNYFLGGEIIERDST